MAKQESARGIRRRKYLTSLAGGVTATAATSVATTGTAAANVSTEHYGSVVDVVDAGADNGGNESITPVIRDVIEDDTLLQFPPGRYYMDEQVRFTDFDNLGLRGNDATLVPANYHDFEGPQYRLFRFGTTTLPVPTSVSAASVDQTAEDTGIRAFETYASDTLEVRNINVVGRHDSGTWGPGLFVVTDPDGDGLVRGLPRSRWRDARRELARGRIRRPERYPL